MKEHIKIQVLAFCQSESIHSQRTNALSISF